MSPLPSAGFLNRELESILVFTSTSLGSAEAGAIVSLSEVALLASDAPTAAESVPSLS